MKAFLKHTSTFLIVSTVFLQLAPFAQAQQPQQSQDMLFTCLKIKKCSDRGPQCPQRDTNPDPEKGDYVIKLNHASELSGKGDNPNGTADDSKNPLPDKPAHVLECLYIPEVPAEENPICTTGNGATDVSLMGVDVTQRLKELTKWNGAYGDDREESYDNSYRFDQFVKCVGDCQIGGEWENNNTFPSVPNPQPPRVPGANFGTYYWQSFTGRDISRSFFALQTYTAPPVVNPVPGEPTPTQTASQQSLQQATLDFAKTLTPVTREPDQGDCAFVKYDPYGKVFDARTLEPIAGAKVTLERKRADGTYTKLISGEQAFEYVINPYTTGPDGAFTFAVSDGDYRLQVEHPDYDFPTQANILNREYAKVYSDIYPSLTGNVITQKGNSAEHRDIPLVLKSGHTYSQPIRLDSYFQTPNANGETYLTGLVSHPFANLTFYTKKLPAKGTVATRFRAIGKAQADKDGKFSFMINTKSFEPGEYFGEADIEKNFAAIPDKTNSKALFQLSAQWITSLFVGEALAQDKSITTVSFEPIPTYLEGYAYDAKGELIKSGEVGLYLNQAKTPIISTSTDATGYFRIPSTKVPLIKYKIIAKTSGGEETAIRTSSFIEKNTKYLADNKINVFSGQNDKGSALDLAQKSNGSGEFKTNLGGQRVTPFTALETATSNSTFVFAALLSVLIIATLIIVGMLVFYVVKIRKQNTSS